MIRTWKTPLTLDSDLSLLLLPPLPFLPPPPFLQSLFAARCSSAKSLDAVMRMCHYTEEVTGAVVKKLVSAPTVHPDLATLKCAVDAQPIASRASFSEPGQPSGQPNQRRGDDHRMRCLHSAETDGVTVEPLTGA
eukprot:3928250-Rhodomonas_salina.1